MKESKPHRNPKVDPASDPEREAILQSLRSGSATLIGETPPATVPEGGPGSPEASPAVELTAVSGEPTQPEIAVATESPPEPGDVQSAPTISVPSAAAKPQTDAAEKYKAEWDRLQRERAELTAQRLALERERTQPRTNGQYSPEDYEAVAKQYELDGNDVMAQRAREHAQEARKRETMTRLQAAHAASIRDALVKHPDLANAESALYKRLDSLLKSRPVFFSYAEGIGDAIEAAVSQDRADRVGALEAELSEMREKLSRQERLLHPVPGGPPALGRAGEVAFDKLPTERQKALILSALRASG